jgi:alpha-tubulin suppressor-like RCC1 family protein
MTSIRMQSIWLLAFLAGCGTAQTGSSTPEILWRTSQAAPTLTATSTAAANTRIPSGTSTPSPDVSGTAVAAGKSHSCVVLNDGAVACWGDNQFGQLGDGRMTGSNVPVNVVGVSDAAMIVAGWGHTCAVSRIGQVKCWGYNKNGELGNGSTQDSSVPVDVIGLSSGVIALEAGDDHTCAVTGAGRVMCWGYNEFGQLGDGTTESRSVPVEAQAITGRIRSVAAGWGHTCVLTEDNGVKCWGNNQLGQLGYGQEADYRFTPVDVLEMGRGVAEITADGGSTCARTAGGGIKCWGNNKYGQLGDGTAELRNQPVSVAGLNRNAVRVAMGWNHGCAVAWNGELRCWGWNYYGQLGDGTKTSRLEPVKVKGLADGVAAIGAGWGHTCIITDLGGVKCWGLNEYGQLGDGTQLDSTAPIAVFGIHSALVRTQTNTPAATRTNTPSSTFIPTATATPTVASTDTVQPTPTPILKTSTPSDTPGLLAVEAAIAITSKENHTCALTIQGGVRCWGDNTTGQLGDGTTLTARSTPVEVIGLGSAVSAVAAGTYHTCARTIAGGVKCWGHNANGQLGDGTTTQHPTPVDVIGLSSGVEALGAGYHSTCVLLTGGGVQCWGGNVLGQLGDGTTTDRLTPVDVIGLSSGVRSIAVGLQHVCVLMDAGGVKCWGSNFAGQLGDGTTTDRFTPVNVKGLPGGIVALSAGSASTCALTRTGGVKCWGSNSAGGLGDGTGIDRLLPVDVSGLSSGVLAVTLGHDHACAVISGGGVKCWGWNVDGQLGDGTKNSRYAPVDVGGLGGSAVSLAEGIFHSCAIIDGGGVQCWGNNSDGSLGDGTTASSFTPVDVIGFGGTTPTLTPTPGNDRSLTRTYTISPAQQL